MDATAGFERLLQRGCRALLLSTALALAACGGGGGGDEAPPPDPSLYRNPVAYAFDGSAALASATEGGSDTQHQLQLGSSTLSYRAHAGHLNALDPLSGQSQASVFHIAYTRSGLSAEEQARRPLIFFYNGGPGSASIWLHLGAFGPQRLVSRNPALDIPTPYQLVDNAETLLDRADLVFVDAIGTGWSQAIAPRSNQSFWGVDADARLFRDFVLRYLARHERRQAPVLLFGESYGGLRSPLLATALLSAGVNLQGVVLQSAILNYGSNCAVLDSAAVSCAPFVPSYGATAAWFQRARPQPPQRYQLDDYVQQVADFSDTRYAPAAEALLRQSLPISQSVLQQMADYSGLSLAQWQAAPLLKPEAYRQQLLPQQLLGRYDSRVAVASTDPLAREGDPSSTLITAPFRAALAALLQNTLKYQAAVAYRMFNEEAIQRWNWRHDGAALPDAVPDLAAALLLQPQLRILVLGGYHDLATPFRLTEQDLARLQPAPPGLRLRRYVGGHMTYLDDQVRPQMLADLRALLADLPSGRSTEEPR